MPHSLNLVFCGTPSFAVPALDALVAAGFEIQLVVTQPDRPKGRGLERTPSPIKERALELNLPLTQPDRIKNNEQFRAQLAAIKPQAIIVVAYGRIIPQWMLDLPPMGNINLHASLLPKYRGAAPIQWAIANGESVTGVTTMKIDAGLDTGIILLQESVEIGSTDTAQTLTPKLASIGANLIVTTVNELQAGNIRPKPQDDSQATLAPILKKEDGLTDFSRPAVEIYNRMRGFQPWPGIYARFRGKNMQIWSASAVARSFPLAELRVEGEHLFVGCGENTALDLFEVQVEGKKRAYIAEFLRGYRIQPGEKLGG